MAVHFICRIEDLVASGSQLVWSLAHHTLRRWFNQGLMLPCRRYLKTWLRIGECYQMTEGRLCLVHLLDDRKLELLVQPKLLSRELLDLVSSHFNLKEKEYFGLCFIDDTGQNNWLQLERRVLDHAFSKKTGPLELKFLVRFYIEKITFLNDNTTVELFFLNAKSSVFNEAIEVESKKVFKLAAFALQEAKGEYTTTETARSDLKQLPVLPTNVLKEHPSLSYCEDRVIEHYAELRGLSRGQAVVQYLALVESLPTYGVHYYPVKDKQGIPWWLGVSYKGIGQYDFQDKVKPRKLFQWKQLENLYFREKKFAVEVNDPHKRAITKRTFGQTGLVIHSWYASHSLIKTIWAMAISQHQFYLDRKQSKSKLTSTRSTGDIAMDLTEVAAPRVSKLSSMQGKDQLIMASNGSLISAGSGESDADEQQKREKMAELKRREKALQDRLAVKLEELKTICVREAELTGKLPKEYPLATGEKAPQIRRRVGAAFKLDDLFPYNEDPHLRDLESKFALQHKIVEAARRLADEGDLCKTVKRKRRNNCLDATRRLHAIEGEINAYRVRMGKKPTQRASLIIADDVNPSELSSLSDSLTLEDDDELGSQRQRSRSIQYSPRPHHSDSRLKYGQAQEPLGYSPHDEALSSLYAPASRQPRDARSMPPTPLLTRNAYSSTQLRCDDVSQHFRQRSGSLESQSHFPAEGEPGSRPAYVTVAPPPRRSNSTEVLDDGSSYTSQSSAEYSGPGNHHHHHHNPRVRGRHRKELYAGTGSMPNLAQPEAHCYAYQPRERPSATAYYVTGYPGYAAEPEPYAYDDETEGHYSVAPVYQHHQHRHHAQEPYGCYGNDEADSMSQYATLRHAHSRAHPAQSQPQSRCPGNEHPGRTMQKALVAEHLRGWYQRNTGHRQQVAYDYDRGSQQSLGYQTMAEPYASSVCYSSASSASTRTWQGHMGGSGPVEYDVSMHAHQSYSYSTALYSQPAHSRSYIDVHQIDSAISSQMNNHLGPEDQIHWHEDSKPGTIV